MGEVEIEREDAELWNVFKGKKIIFEYSPEKHERKRLKGNEL